jgi:hypothetical protein
VTSVAVRGSVGALVFGALAVGCVEVERVPIHTMNTPAATPIGSEPRPAVTSAQPAPPPITESTIPEPSSSNEMPSSETPDVTESQPDSRLRAAQAVGLASQQVARLRMMATSANGLAPRPDVDAAFGELQIKRENVLQDLRELELRPSDDLLMQLDGDVASLRGAIRDSYGVAPPPSQGLAQPSPLPPSEAWPGN